MAQVHMTPEQLDLLVELLERELIELRTEIHHTDSRSYRDRLLARKQALDELLGVLREHHAGVAS